MQLQPWTMEEVDQLIHFMTTNTWPFDAEDSVGRDLAEKRNDEGGYASDDVKTFWVLNEDKERVGIVKIYDLRDDVPLFDLRIADRYRGRGYGSRAFKKVAEYVFQLEEKKSRLAGHTRQDHVAMRKTFERAGFVKEGQLRRAWFAPKENRYYDAVTYGMTREDFEKGTSTPLVWDGYDSIDPLKSMPETIESERLYLRAPSMEHVERIWRARIRSHEELKEWLSWAQTRPTKEEIEAHTRETIAHFMLKKELTFHLFTKKYEEFVGIVTLKNIDWSIPSFELGYWLDTAHSGEGYMLEAVDRLSQFAFQSLCARRVEIRVAERNWKSRRIPEKLGFQLEGILRQNALTADGTHLRNTCIYGKID